MRARLAQLLEERLDQLELAIDGAPALRRIDPGESYNIDLSRRGAHGAYRLMHLPAMTLAELSRVDRSVDDLPLLLVGDRIAERTAQSFRELGIQYLDAAGNALIAFDNVLIDIRGRRSAIDSPPDQRERSTNLFSSARARVIFVLLAWPELARVTVREVAATAGVSAGLAHESLNLLQGAGYLSPGQGLRRSAVGDLLDLWGAAYPTGLARTLSLARFGGSVDEFEPTGDKPVYLSGESAVPELLRPVSLTIYLDSFDPRLVVKNRWRTDDRTNIWVRRKFWNPPRGYRASSAPVMRAPWPLVYADLMATGESRQLEAARSLKEENLEDWLR
jgi:hypothetical protein